MKKKLTYVAAFVLSFSSAEAQITLTDANFPQLASYTRLDGGNILDFPFGASPNTWDFGDIVMPADGQIDYFTASDPFFTGVSQVYETGTRTLMGFNYDVEYYWTKNADLFGQNAWRIYAANNSLTAFTGGTSDALNVPDQRLIFNEPRVVLDFPVTMGYTRSSDSRRITEFNLTLESYGLNNAPGQLVTHLLRYDTVVAYGQMSVYTPQGPSIFYDVLALQSYQYEVDSFYLNGSPAPDALLTAFGLTQNQVDASDSNNRLYFYREFYAPPLMLLNFGSDPFQSYNRITVHAEGLQTAALSDLDKGSYQVFVYPNPGNRNNQNMRFIGKEISAASYEIRDLQGKLIYRQAELPIQGNLLHIETGAAAPGTYIITVRDQHDQLLANQQISIQ